MVREKYVLACLLLLAGVSSSPAASITTVTAAAGSSTCSRTGTTSAACNTSAMVGTQTATASALATSSWTTTVPGTLEATAAGFGMNTSSNAAVSYSNMLLVTGASGSGNLQINFTGFQMNILNIPGGASVSPVSVGLGGAATTATLPNSAGPTAFSVTLPIAFGTPVVFSTAFSATASGTFFNNGTYALDDADGILQFPTFAVTSSAGVPIPTAAVTFTPEPSTWLMLMVGLSVVGWWIGFDRCKRRAR